ncbi:MAG: carboxylating nicotinate-nucleotide diphosphorylase [Myxococcota bacterium]
MPEFPNWDGLTTHPDVTALIDLAIREDVGDGDATTEAIFKEAQPVVATLVARSETVACGLPLARAILGRFDSEAQVQTHAADGHSVAAGTALLTLTGDVRAILTSERAILNFLMRLCGIAALTRAAVEQLPPGSKTQILDTRKTMPGWRVLDKAAVVTGGGANHRVGLFDGVIIKDNHIAAAGSLSAAVASARTHVGNRIFVQVEVDTLEQLDEALASNPDLILLDNFDLAMLREAVARTQGRIPLEASGGMTVSRIHEVAATGVDRISMGALTHSAMPADLALDFRGH